MTRPRLYIDEDSMDDDFVKALRVRGVDVRTASDDGMRGRPDVDQLRRATEQGASCTASMLPISALCIPPF